MNKWSPVKVYPGIADASHATESGRHSEKSSASVPTTTKSAPSRVVLNNRSADNESARGSKGSINESSDSAKEKILACGHTKTEHGLNFIGHGAH
ncbi:MAG TPA: hypothetical protein VGS11_10970 [Candidatus Bathyarchaeia archaeon]|nr:hypothetical protein [Candidatus Bathyarchaeia archaeon]